MVAFDECERQSNFCKHWVFSKIRTSANLPHFRARKFEMETVSIRQRLGCVGASFRTETMQRPSLLSVRPSTTKAQEVLNAFRQVAAFCTCYFTQPANSWLVVAIPKIQTDCANSAFGCISSLMIASAAFSTRSFFSDFGFGVFSVNSNTLS